MNRYDWKDMRGTVVVKDKRPKQSLLKLLLEKRKAMYDAIDKLVSERINEISNH